MSKVCSGAFRSDVRCWTTCTGSLFSSALACPPIKVAAAIPTGIRNLQDFTQFLLLERDTCAMVQSNTEDVHSSRTYELLHDMSKKLSETLQELRRRRKVLFFTVRVEAEQLCNAGESEEKIRSRLGLKHGCPPELIGTIIRTKGEEMPAT